MYIQIIVYLLKDQIHVSSRKKSNLLFKILEKHKGERKRRDKNRKGSDKKRKWMLATSDGSGGLYFQDDRCENSGRQVIRDRKRLGNGGRVFLRWSLRLRHLAFHCKYLFYGRWHGSLTLTAARSVTDAPPKIVLEKKNSFTTPRNIILYISQAVNQIILLPLNYI